MIRWRTTTSAPSMASAVPSASPSVQSHDEVVRCVLVELWRARLGRLLGVDDDRERGVVDLDCLRGVFGRCLALGHDHGDPVAGPSHGVNGQDARRVEVVLDATGCPGARQRVDRLHVLAGPHAKHAGHRGGRGGVDRVDLGVGIR